MTNPFKNIPLLPPVSDTPIGTRVTDITTNIERKLCPDGNWRIVPKPCPQSLVEESFYGTSSPGWCLACGEQADEVEPDARRYQCDACGLHQVFGAEECCLMGYVFDDSHTDYGKDERALRS
jgi:hypothetical protein